MLAGRFAFLCTTVSLLVCLTLDGLASSQTSKQASCVVEDIDTASMPACVIQSRNGVLFILKKYWMHPAFNRCGLSGSPARRFWGAQFLCGIPQEGRSAT